MNNMDDCGTSGSIRGNLSLSDGSHTHTNLNGIKQNNLNQITSYMK